MVNVYTTREPGLAAPLFEAFTKATGHYRQQRVREGWSRRAREGRRRSLPADVLMTVDVGNLLDVVDAGVTQPCAPPPFWPPCRRISAIRRATGMRSPCAPRLVYASKDLNLGQITYEGLADPKWSKEICIRSGQHPYNVGLTAAYIVHHGAERPSSGCGASRPTSRARPRRRP